jgi:Tfp pilus assembly protein PilF
MTWLAFVILILLLPVCSFVPGYLIVRRFRWTHLEKTCGAIVLSEAIIYLTATVVYWIKIDWQSCWAITIMCIVLTVLHRTQIWKFVCHRAVRDAWLAFGLIFLCGLLVQTLALHYSGAYWGTDWLEHYERTVFFLSRLPFDTVFLNIYLLPARPPMSHLIAAFFMGQSGGAFDHFQIIFLFLNALIVFPCILIGECMKPLAGRRSWLIAAFLITCPMVIENITYTWNKQAAAFFILCSLAFYLRGWRRGDTGRMVMSGFSMAAAILMHYSAGPYAVFLVAHYIFAAPKKKSVVLRTTSAAGVLLATWFGWSIAVYGVFGTFMTNTTAAETSKLSTAQNILTALNNIYCTLVPHPFRLSSEQFGVVFDQPNRFGYVRDYFFYLYQPNLFLSLGLFGWVVALWLLWKEMRNAEAVMRRFWICLIVVLIVLGIAVHGAEDIFGLAHICLQPLSLLGRVLLAAGFLSLRPKLRLALVFSMIADVVLGIVLQCRIQMHAIRDFQLGDIRILPFSRGLLGIEAVSNSIIRFHHSLIFLGDHFGAISPLILCCLVMLLGISLVTLANVAQNGCAKFWQPPRIAAGITFVIFLTTSAVCISDRAMGFAVLNDTVAPVIPSTQEINQRIAPLVQHVQAEPESAQAYETLGIAEYELCQLNQANDALEKALLLNPDLKDAHYVLLLIHSLNNWRQPPGDPIIAIISRTYAQDSTTYVNYGLALYSRNLRHKGFEVLSDAVERFPNDASTHQALAMAFFNEGKINQAADEITKSLALNPDSSMIMNQMAMILRAQGESPDSIEQKIAGAIHPNKNR